MLATTALYIYRNAFHVQQGALDLMISNLLVLVTSFYRFFRSGKDIENTDNDSDSTAKTSESIDTLTTVDLERLETLSIRTTQSAPPPQSETTLMRNLSLRSTPGVMVEQAY